MNILFICHQNVGRSQMAQALYTKITGKPALSAATHVNIENQRICDRPLAEPVVRYMQKEGIDMSQARAKQVTKEMLDYADLIVVMNQTETIPDYLKNHPKAIYWELQDPSGRDDAFFEEIIMQIKLQLSLLTE